MRSLHLKKLFQVKLATELFFSGTFCAFRQSFRCHSIVTSFLSGGSRRNGTKVGETITVAAAANEIGNQSDKSRGTGFVQISRGLPEMRAHLGEKLDRPRSGYSKSESGLASASGSGNEELQSNPTSNVSRKSFFDFNAHVTSILSSPGGEPSIIDAFVKEWLPGCSVNEVSNFMRISGKKSKYKSYLHLKRHLPSIASRIESLLSYSWRPKDVSSALYGLQCLQENDDGYLIVVAAMTAALSKSIQSGRVTPWQSISMIMVGLQKNGLNASQSLDLVRSLTIAMKSCEESLSAQALGNALYGMQSMSSDYAEVRSMLSALSGKVHSCKESLDAQAVGNALYGMQSISCDASFAIHAFLLRHISVLPHVEHLSRVELLSVGQAILLCIASRRDVLNGASYKMWTEYGDSVCSEHRRRITSGECVDSFRSNVEKSMHRAALRTLGQSSVMISSNEYLFDMFESDIALRIPFVESTDETEASDEGKWLVINIEVDGVRHTRERKINFCKLRDAYLKSRGVVVHRIDASRVTKMDDNQVQQWLLDVVAESLLVCDEWQSSG